MLHFFNANNVDNKYNIFYQNAKLGTLRYVQAPSFPIQKYSGQFSLSTCEGQ